MGPLRRILAWKADALAIVLVLVDLTVLSLAIFGLAITYLGMAATVANVHASGNTVEKGILAAALSAWWLPYFYAVVAIALTVFLCGRFIHLTRQPPVTATLPVRNDGPPDGFVAGALSNEIATLRVERDAALKKQDELHRQLEVARTHPPIYFTQVEELEAWDPMRLATGRTTRTIKKLNPFFLKVDELEKAQAQLSAAQAQLEACKKKTADEQKTEADLAAPLIKGQTVRLTDFVPPGAAAIRGKVFEDCTIFGPAVIALDGPVGIEDVQFSSSQATFFIEAQVESSESGPDGVIYMRECTLRRCSLAQVAIIGTKAQIDEYKRRFRGTALQESPALFGRVLRFEPINVSDLSEADFKAFDKETRAEGSTEVWFEYLVHVEIENSGPATRTKEWRFGMKRIADGAHIEPIPIVRHWPPSPSWPRYDYENLDDIQGHFLEPQRVYHVILNLRAHDALQSLDVRSFVAGFADSAGGVTICRMT